MQEVERKDASEEVFTLEASHDNVRQARHRTAEGRLPAVTGKEERYGYSNRSQIRHVSNGVS